MCDKKLKIINLFLGFKKKKVLVNFETKKKKKRHKTKIKQILLNKTLESTFSYMFNEYICHSIFTSLLFLRFF